MIIMCYTVFGDIMNKFYTDNFNISKINACVYVSAGTGQPIHKNRPYHGLVIKLEGTNKYNFDNGKVYEVNANDVFYLPKFSSYRVDLLKSGDCIAINFDLADESVTYPFFSVKTVGNTYKKLFEKLNECWNLKKDGYLNQCYMQLYSIICQLQSDLAMRYIPSKTRSLAYRGSEFIAQNITDHTLTVKKVSDNLGISPEYFRKIFSDIYGSSPKKFIIDMRMDKAKSLLRLKEFSIGEISRMCGYDSESYFSSEFRKICKCTPSEYGEQ